MLVMGAVLRRPEVTMETYGSEGSGGQGVSGFVSNVLLLGGPKSELLCGGQCGTEAACALPVRLSTAMSTAVRCGAALGSQHSGERQQAKLVGVAWNDFLFLVVSSAPAPTSQRRKSDPAHYH